MALFSFLEKNIGFFEDSVRPALDQACQWSQGLLEEIMNGGSLVGDRLCQFVEGAWLTVELTLVSVLLGLILAVPLALARLSKYRLLSGAAFAYMFYFRGTPLIVQIFIIYAGSGQFSAELRELGLWNGLFREAYFAAVLSLTLNTAAYSAEILRGGIKGVPFGEVEAARACGMSGTLLYRRIILPKAARIALPAYSNEVVFLFQATSLVSVITMLDLAGVARDVNAETFRDLEVWSFVGLCYLGMSYGIFYLFKRAERRLMRHLGQRPDKKIEIVPTRA